MRRLAVTTLLITLALPAATSHAAFFPSISVGAGAITETRDVDLAQDGTGAVTFGRTDGVVTHAYVNRIVNGAFLGPERIDAGLEGGSSQISVGAGSGGRLAVMFVSGGALYGALRPSATAPWTAPVLIATGGSDPSVDMTVHGAAFGVYRVGGDVYGAYIPRQGGAWFPHPGPLDFDPAREAGTGSGRPRVAASAAGSAVAVWGETAADGLRHVYARRLFQGPVSQYPQDLTLPSFEGRLGRDAGDPDIAIEDDESYAWVAFRQTFLDAGVPKARIVLRQMRGSTFDPPAVPDPVGWSGSPVGPPSLNKNSRGEGIAMFADFSGAAIAATLKDGRFFAGSAVGAATSEPAMGSATGALASAFVRSIYFTEGSPPVVKGRTYEDSSRKRVLTFPGPTTGLTTAQFGVVATETGFDVSGDSAGDSLVYFAQGPPGARNAVVAGFDLPPDKPTALSKWSKSRAPLLTWKSDGDSWGPVTYRVYVGGTLIGQTTAQSFQSPRRLKFGKRYAFRVDAVDARGQITRSTTTRIGIDQRPPTVHASFERSGRRLTVRSRVEDKGTKKRPAAGIEETSIDWGDGNTQGGSSASHTYREGGRKKVKITAIDKAGNRRTITKRV